ncbi:MAG TPA: GAF domain-containing sensor histidine kinase [Longimicrobium sp.]|jgi:signal transduction histidine kinase
MKENTPNAAPASPLHDPERLGELRATALLDSPTEEAFDRLTRLASKLLQAPISTVTLVDDQRQFYLSCTGMPEPLASARETPLEMSFCKHTVVLGAPLIIPDTHGHPMVGDNPAVHGFGVRAYAGIPLLTPGGHAIGTLCVMDFVPRQWTDDQVSSLTDLAAAVSTEIELRMDIAERTRVEAALNLAVRMRDEVLGVVSHDLRNPVHTVSLSAGFLLDTLPNGPQEAPVRKQLGIIVRAAEQMDRLIRDLLDVASIASGHLPVERGRRDAVALARAACETLQPLAEERGLRFEIRTPPAPLPVLADSDRIHQVLSNLVGNAIKFTPAGGLITLGLQAGEGEARFSVSDTGPGIPPDQCTHIFDQFWQADRSGRHGAGLGLAIARGIVETHGGEIRVASTVGVGTTFTFTIPLADA